MCSVLVLLANPEPLTPLQTPPLSEDSMVRRGTSLDDDENHHEHAHSHPRTHTHTHHHSHSKKTSTHTRHSEPVEETKGDDKVDEGGEDTDDGDEEYLTHLKELSGHHQLQGHVIVDAMEANERSVLTILVVLQDRSIRSQHTYAVYRMLSGDYSTADLVPSGDYSQR